MELTKINSCHSQLFYNRERNLNWKANIKDHTEEALQNLSSDNVYLLFISFCRFHEFFGLI